jgi:geranylgeranyl pyrophosphate synthase
MLQPFFDIYKPIIQQKISDYTKTHFDDPRQELLEAIQYSLSPNGKYLRPLLCISSFLLFNKKENVHQILPLSCSFEMVHTYSLIHDDLPAMDDDNLRRGQPTCHVQYDEATAILAGDTLNTLVYEILAKDLPQWYSPEQVLRIIIDFSKALGLNGMVGGQMMDLKGSNQIQNKDYLKTLHSLKTGAILKACIVLPAILENADKEIISHLSSFGHHIGLLFQIIDDILDVTSPSDTLGKTSNKDLSQKKLTYVSLYGITGAEELVKLEADSATCALNKLKPALDISLFESLLTFVIQRKS